MKVTHYLKYLILLTGIFLFDSCKDDNFEVPNGIKINFQATSMLKSSADTILLKEAYLGIGNIDLKRAGETDSSVIEKIVYKGPYVVDLLNGFISPSIRWIFAEPGYYREIEIKTHKALTEGMSIILKGTIMPADGTGDLPFELITARDYTLNIKNNTGIEIRAGENVDLLVVFDLSDLFKDIDLSSINRNENGILVISEEDGPNTVTLLVDKLEAFSRFGIDDGQFPINRSDENPDKDDPEEDEDIGDEGDDDTRQEEADDNSDNENPGEDSPDEGDEDEGDSGEDDSEGSAGSDDDNPDEGNEDTSGNIDDGNTGINDEEDSANEDGNDDEDDSSDEGGNEEDPDDDSSDANDIGNDNDDSDDGEEDDVINDEGDDDDSSGENADDTSDDSDNSDSDNSNNGNSNKDKDKNKDKGKSDKGNNGNSGRGN